MIEREFIAQKTKELAIKEYIEQTLPKVGISQIKLKKIPLGEKIIISTSRPSLVVGSRGANIKELTRVLKKKFKLENPQIEISEVKNPFLDVVTIAQRISSSLERFGSARFKSIGHRIVENVMQSGAIGVEVVLSGKIPGARAKSWRFYQGYLKKSGEASVSGVQKAQASALLKSGIIGIKVSLMPPDVQLPDRVTILQDVAPLSSEAALPAVGSLAALAAGMAEGKSDDKKTDDHEKKVKKPRKRPVKKKAVENAADTISLESSTEKNDQSPNSDSSSSTTITTGFTTGGAA